MDKFILIVSLIYALWYLVEVVLESLGVGRVETREFWQFVSLASLIVQGIYMLILRTILLHLPISDKKRKIIFTILLILFLPFFYCLLFIASWGTWDHVIPASGRRYFCNRMHRMQWCLRMEDERMSDASGRRYISSRMHRTQWCLRMREWAMRL